MWMYIHGKQIQSVSIKLPHRPSFKPKNYQPNPEFHLTSPHISSPNIIIILLSGLIHPSGSSRPVWQNIHASLLYSFANLRVPRKLPRAWAHVIYASSSRMIRFNRRETQRPGRFVIMTGGWGRLFEGGARARTGLIVFRGRAGVAACLLYMMYWWRWSSVAGKGGDSMVIMLCLR